jgi:protein TonB
LTAASTKEARDALYLDDWRGRIEQIGNLNYPAEARINRIYGQLILLVAVKTDGSVHEVRVLRSSGHRVLDDAAIRIVRLAEPFAPFPESIARDTDILEIIRTWEFGKNDSLTNF